jgi:mannose-6-phosphate isomerase-like protein (cupin superfamily)
MNTFSAKRLAACAALIAASVSPVANADWQRDDKSIAWRAGDQVLWRFSFDSEKGKPFFDPLSINGTRLTNFRPEDHPWHYGLWFSWKYVNGANYWEENRQSGQAEGKTAWSAPEIEARPDGSATIRMNVTYAHPSGRVDLTEVRELVVSAPSAQGAYTIQWNSNFTAGKEGAVLDRTPMPGEPDGKVNGGYAGLGARLAAAPLKMSVVTPEGSITEFASDRARPATSAVAANFQDQDRAVGSIAIWSDPGNIAERAPWYVINAPQDGMRFLCAAVLAPQVRKLAPDGEWRLRYRIAVQPQPFTPESLKAAVAEWRASVPMRSAAFDWNEIPAKQDGVRTLRQFFQGPTATLDDIEFHTTRLAAGETSHPPHRHPNEEMVIVKEGTVEALVNGTMRRLGPGSVIFNASNELHAIRNVGTGPATYHVINWHTPATPRPASGSH